jgi:hypothetical protein
VLLHELPLVRIAGGVMRCWSSPFAGPGALAVDRGRVLALGGYSARDRVVLAAIKDGPAADPLAGRVQQLAEYALRGPDGTPFREASAIGRGATLHVFDGPDWYRLDVADL